MELLCMSGASKQRQKQLQSGYVTSLSFVGCYFLNYETFISILCLSQFLPPYISPWCLMNLSYNPIIISDRLAAKLARKESLNIKLQQRPNKQEMIDRGILFQVSEEERKQERTIIGAKLIRRLSLRPTPEELEDRNILKSRMIGKKTLTRFFNT